MRAPHGLCGPLPMQSGSLGSRLESTKKPGQQRIAIFQKGVSQFILNLISLTPRLEFPGVNGFNFASASLLFVALILLICGYASYKALHHSRASFRCSSRMAGGSADPNALKGCFLKIMDDMMVLVASPNGISKTLR